MSCCRPPAGPSRRQGDRDPPSRRRFAAGVDLRLPGPAAGLSPRRPVRRRPVAASRPRLSPAGRALPGLAGAHGGFSRRHRRTPHQGCAPPAGGFAGILPRVDRSGHGAPARGPRRSGSSSDSAAVLGGPPLDRREPAAGAGSGGPAAHARPGRGPMGRARADRSGRDLRVAGSGASASEVERALSGENPCLGSGIGNRKSEIEEAVGVSIPDYRFPIPGPFHTFASMKIPSRSRSTAPRCACADRISSASSPGTAFL
jgi:hypothetical protein